MPANLATTDIPCPLWRRLLALVYDLLIVIALLMVVGLLCELATGGELIRTEGQVVVPAWYRILQGLVIAAYFISSWRRGGQTVGMRPWRIRLVRDDGGKPTWQQAIIRVAVAGAPMVLLMLAPMLGLRSTLWTLLVVWAGWFAVALFDRRRRALHDLAAGTEIRRMD